MRCDACAVDDDGDDGPGILLKCRSCRWILCEAHARNHRWCEIAERRPDRSHTRGRSHSSSGSDRLLKYSLTETLEQNGDELYQILEAAVDSSKNLDVLDRFLARTRYLALNINVKMDQVKLEANMQPPTKCRKLKFGPVDND